MNVGIRTWRIEDSPNLTRALNNKKILDNLRDGIPFPYSISDAESFISAMLSSDRETTYAWAITVDDIAVGSISAFRKDNVHRLTAEMGYYVAEEYWGKGIATKAVKLACQYILPHRYNSYFCRTLCQ